MGDGKNPLLPNLGLRPIAGPPLPILLPPSMAGSGSLTPPPFSFHIPAPPSELMSFLIQTQGNKK